MNEKAPAVAIVVAAGSGSRLGADVPKALVGIDGVPMVRRCLDALADGVPFAELATRRSNPGWRDSINATPTMQLAG